MKSLLSAQIEEARQSGSQVSTSGSRTPAPQLEITDQAQHLKNTHQNSSNSPQHISGSPISEEVSLQLRQKYYTALNLQTTKPVIIRRPPKPEQVALSAPMVIPSKATTNWEETRCYSSGTDEGEAIMLPSRAAELKKHALELSGDYVTDPSGRKVRKFIPPHEMRREQLDIDVRPQRRDSAYV
eukprot:c33074_g1_i1.p1 GENE.c33074_g1_i1~~c33074_g1_i1.p1  ORF type:complete len:184 (+),score=16.65 c33074_g1_i1:64-615(+)